MKRLFFFGGIILIFSALISCNKKGEFDSHPPAVNKRDFKLSTSQSGKDTLYVTKNTKLEAEGVTYGEVKYTGGEASIIKINNWGTIEKTTIARHKKAYAMAYIGKRPSDIQLSLFVIGVNGGTVVTVK